ncbi:MAG: phosphate ABC transporter, permease protein PstA [Actinobacteria bacterium HGW-Actinobacteria-10]|jgi:phosphate transport system permease protein|nr:MAG: phosphate ABC transporter, permease protein PstA [Actinobacteria bacterium HGW-Actinobacteria-10]
MNRSARVRRARRAEAIMKAITGASLLGVLGLTVLILAAIAWRGLPAMSAEFIFALPRSNMTEGGIWPAIVGTFWLTVGTGVFAVPIGVAAGVYLAEYAKRGIGTRLIRLSIANMAGVPSIVYGLFGLSVFVMVLKFNQSLLAGSLTLACLTLPVIITATEESMRQVPGDLRHASLALGATRLRTILRVVLPAAGPGIVTGSVLGLSRAAGETAPILVTAAAFSAPLPKTPFDRVMALPYHLYIMATQAVKPAPLVVWGTALVLVAGVTFMGVLAATWRSRQRRKIRW